MSSCCWWRVRTRRWAGRAPGPRGPSWERVGVLGRSWVCYCPHPDCAECEVIGPWTWSQDVTAGGI